MARARFRFTIGQLIKLVTILAVVLALWRIIPVWPIFLILAVILWGSAIDRDRGGPGLLGAMAGGAVVGLALTLGMVMGLVPTDRRLRGATEICVQLYHSALAGTVAGFAVGTFASLILLPFGRPVRPVDPPAAEEIGPIAWRGLGDDQ